MKCLLFVLSLYVTICNISAIESSAETNKHNFGEAIKLLKFEESKDYGLVESLDEDVLKKLLLHDDVINRKIVVVSIVGGFRKGKTYLIDYCLRYLYAHYKSINFPNNPLKTSSNWFGDKDEVLKGFSFRSGSKSLNTEIVIWSDVFLDSNNKDGNIAIILMDTQGFFEKEDLTYSTNTRTFIFGTLVSSVLILNLDNQIHLEQMKYLQMTTEFTKDSLECHKTPFIKPFQNLNFVMRNWSNIQEFPLGLNEGNKFIMNSFEETINSSFMTNVMSSFANINSFLLPFPGTMIRLKKSTGCWNQMDVDFKNQLKLLIEYVFESNTLVIKKVNGVKMTGSQLNQKIKSHFNAIQSKLFVDKFLKDYKQQLAESFKATKSKNMETFKSSHKASKTHAKELAKKTNASLVHILDSAFDLAFDKLNYNKDEFDKLNVTIDGDSLKHPYGEALNVMCFNVDTDRININFTAVYVLMNHTEIRDRKVVLLSMTGLYRHGKSSFMDYCLRYMYANYKSINFMDNPLNNKDGWLGDDSDILTGFTYNEGKKRQGSGIVFWSDVFLFDDETGEKLAIFLVDTQGFFENDVEANQSKILEFSTLISSIQIFNLKNKLNLKYLEFATDYAEHLKVGGIETNGTHKPLQNLLFLGRDWEESQTFGYEDGKVFLGQILESYQLEQNRKVQKNIPLSYDNVSCFVLPYPGRNITSVFNNGQLSMVSQVFKDQLKVLIDELLLPSNLVTKKIGEYEVKALELFKYLKAYLEVFQKTKTPTAELFCEKTVDIQMNCFVEKFDLLFQQQLNNLNFGENDIDAIKNKIVDQFKKMKTIGDITIKNKFLKELKEKMENYFLIWKANPVKAPRGKPVKFLSFEDNKVIVDHTALSNMLLNSEVKDRKLVVIAITGITGTLRTFLMNYFLRYMYANYKSINYMDNPLNNKKKWMGAEDEPLKGFPLSLKDDLFPIELWSDVFLHETDAGDKIAIIFMISRGLFGSTSLSEDDTDMFALPTLISSIQIFNLLNLDRKSDINDLANAIDDVKALMKNKTDDKEPFQKMVFLMHNWEKPHINNYGYDGGMKYVLSEFMVDSKHPRYSELSATRLAIMNAFKKIDFFLLPLRGESVQYTDYEGQWRDLSKNFKKQLVIFVESILSPSNLVIKTNNGKEMNAVEYLQQVKDYATMMEIKRNKTIFDETMANSDDFIFGPPSFSN